ncbi:MAG: hypothetical protein KDK78_12260, partial [Chlamydiia bacterium]|nr:hypothetical protein [Chlamydiia bacterium]
TGHAYLADTRATTKLIYALDANKLNKVANLIQFKLSAELGDFTEELDYHFLGANCMGFAQEIVQRGLDTRGSLVDHITEEQFAAHSLLTAPMDNQAMFYAWLTTLSTAVRSVMMIGLLRA